MQNEWPKAGDVICKKETELVSRAVEEKLPKGKRIKDQR
jgi:hypothetical protein